MSPLSLALLGGRVSPFLAFANFDKPTTRVFFSPFDICSKGTVQSWEHFKLPSFHKNSNSTGTLPGLCKKGHFLHHFVQERAVFISVLLHGILDAASEIGWPGATFLLSFWQQSFWLRLPLMYLAKSEKNYNGHFPANLGMGKGDTTPCQK